MKKSSSFILYLYHRRFVRYLFVGGVTFIIDFGSLILLHGKFNANLTLATSIAYWLSVSFNFILNRWWTFNANEYKKLHQHAAEYLVLLGFNYLFTVLFVSLISQYHHYTLVKISAVIIQASWTYPIYKYIIFTSKMSSTDQANP